MEKQKEIYPKIRLSIKFMLQIKYKKIRKLFNKILDDFKNYFVDIIFIKRILIDINIYFL